MSDTTLWKTADGAPVLQGTRCRACGVTYFPESPFCRRCAGSDVERVDLATGGVVETYTRTGPDGEVAVADVRLDDGVLVFGRLIPPDAAEVGRRVRFEPSGDVMTFEIEGSP